MSSKKNFVLAMRKADQRQLRHFAGRGAAPARGKTPSRASSPVTSAEDAALRPTGVNRLDVCCSVTGPVHLFKSAHSLFRKGAVDLPAKKMNRNATWQIQRFPKTRI